MMNMNQTMMDARMRVRDNFTSGLNPAMQQVMAPTMQYGPVSQNTEMQATAGINPMIDPTAKNFSPLAAAAGAGIYGTNLDKKFSFMNPGINTSAVI